MNPYKAEKRSAAVLKLSFSDIASGWEQWLLLTSDNHHDNVYCNRKLERQHLDLGTD